ncbi:MAG: hypothetical protein KDC18_04990 [Alphaproteobacteria bacterium]|nr:hypothetical protein [Alphaproteobacteria bacterium]MCB9930776.1 hypothetical protein [Alphaproteobacteria bacterium]
MRCHRPLLALLLVLIGGLLAGPSAWSQQAPRSASGARVYILDASNSMNGRGDYTGGKSRLARAKEVLLEELQSVAAQGDRRPTAVYVFGSETSWPLTSQREGYRRPADYPYTGGLCQDIVRLDNFGLVTGNFVRRMRGTLASVQASGMTPINIALQRAMAALMPYGGGEIVLISDYESPNCLPPGVDMCADLRRYALERKIDLNAIKIGIYQVPKSNLSNDLRACLQVNEYPVAPVGTEGAGAVRQRQQRVTLELATVYAERPLSPTPPDTATLTYTVTDATTGAEVASGAIGPVEVEPGRYQITIHQGRHAWERTLDVRRSQRVEIPVAPGRVEVEARDSATDQPLRPPVTLQVFRLQSGRPDQPLGDTVLTGARQILALGDGLFKLVGTAHAQTVEQTVELALGDRKAATLHFNGLPQRREGDIRVVMHEPTIDTGRYLPPLIELSRNGRPVRALRPGANPVDLAPGSYEVVIGSRPPHTLPLTVGRTGDRFQATVEITPGWFDARAGQSGVFVLYDPLGNAIAQFRGDRVAQSLADGRYRLEFKGGDQSRSEAEFDISTGHYTPVTLR